MTESTFLSVSAAGPRMAKEVTHIIAVPGGEIRVRAYHPRTDGPLPAYVSIHGGGWWLDNIDVYDHSGRATAAAADAAVFGSGTDVRPSTASPPLPRTATTRCAGRRPTPTRSASTPIASPWVAPALAGTSRPSSPSWHAIARGPDCAPRSSSYRSPTSRCARRRSRRTAVVTCSRGQVWSNAVPSTRPTRPTGRTRTHRRCWPPTTRPFPQRTLGHIHGSHHMVKMAPDAAVYYPLYAKCVEHDLPLSINTGLPGPPVPGECQDPIHLDKVRLRFPERKLCMAHGADPWWGLAIRLMIKYANLHMITSPWSPKRLPRRSSTFRPKCPTSTSTATPTDVSSARANLGTDAILVTEAPTPTRPRIRGSRRSDRSSWRTSRSRVAPSRRASRPRSRATRPTTCAGTPAPAR